LFVAIHHAVVFRFMPASACGMCALLRYAADQPNAWIDNAELDHLARLRELVNGKEFTKAVEESTLPHQW
jgi:hypothetical protein